MVAAGGRAPAPSPATEAALLCMHLTHPPDPSKAVREAGSNQSLKVRAWPIQELRFLCFLVNANSVLAVQEHRIHLEQTTQGRFEFICELLCCLCFIALTFFSDYKVMHIYWDNWKNHKSTEKKISPMGSTSSLTFWDYPSSLFSKFYNTHIHLCVGLCSIYCNLLFSLNDMLECFSILLNNLHTIIFSVCTGSEFGSDKGGTVILCLWVWKVFLYWLENLLTEFYKYHLYF